MILGVPGKVRTDNAVVFGGVKNVSIEAGAALVCSYTGFTLCHVAVGAVESFGSVTINKVLI